MKNITTACLVIVAILFLNNNVNAQAFQKGTINIDLGIGFGLYGTSQTQTYELNATVGGLPLSQKSTNDTTDGALSTVVPISFEYGVTDKIGIGADFIYNNYFINDSDRVSLSSVKAFDYGVRGYYHPLNSDFYDLSIGLGFGLTSIKWTYETVAIAPGISNTPEPSKGSGFYINLDIKNKFWFTEHVGAYLNVGYKGNFYSSISRDNSTTEAQFDAIPGIDNVSIKDEFSFTMHGANIGVGLAVKF